MGPVCPARARATRLPTPSGSRHAARHRPDRGQPSEAFDRVASLAATFVKAPMAMVTLLDDTHLHALSRVGPADLAKGGRARRSRTRSARHVVAAGEPLIVEDAREHELTKGLASVKSGKVLAYAGLPLALRGGHVVGTLCVADAKPRAWKASELAVLEDLARLAVTEIELRADIDGPPRPPARQRPPARRCWTAARSPIYAKDLEGRPAVRQRRSGGA